MGWDDHGQLCLKPLPTLTQVGVVPSIKPWFQQDISYWLRPYHEARPLVPPAPRALPRPTLPDARPPKRTTVERVGRRVEPSSL